MVYCHPCPIYDKINLLRGYIVRGGDQDMVASSAISAAAAWVEQDTWIGAKALVVNGHGYVLSWIERLL